MTLQTTLQSPYSRDAWLALLRDLFGPSAALFARPAPIPRPSRADPLPPKSRSLKGNRYE
jgi:hypothetical protein